MANLNIRKFKKEIRIIQKSCKHKFVTKSDPLKESLKKGVLKAFVKTSEHDHTYFQSCYFDVNVVEAECMECELEIKFSPMEICPKCFKKTMKIKEKVDAEEFIDADDDDTCDSCFEDQYGVDVYECTECSCKVGVIGTSEEKDKEREARWKRISENCGMD